jgi:peptide/nickel transport system ATP-binding protein
MIDVSSRAEILGLLRELQERHGLTYLYITHDIATARHFARRIAIMYLGRIVELGSAADIIREPLHPYTVALLDAVPEPDPANRLRMRTAVAGEVPSVMGVPHACRFHPRCGSFMAGKCDVIDPPLIEVRPARFVACHLYPGPS